MSKGVCLTAQNTDSVDYVEQAYFLALSVRYFNKNIPVSVITNDTVPAKYRSVFDKIIDIPFGDAAETSKWKIENRWKVFYASPYDETIVMDTDCLVLFDLEEAFRKFRHRELHFLTSAKTYRGECITSDYYRKTFTSNNLPNIYTGLFYFKKTENTAKFFETLNMIFDNHFAFYDIFCKEHYPKQQSMDVNVSIATLLQPSELKSNDNKLDVNFVHMKPMVQNWKQEIPENWCDLNKFFVTDDLEVFICNYKQNGILHYVESEFLNEETKRIIEDSVYAKLAV